MDYYTREKIRLRNRAKAIWDTNRSLGLCGYCDEKCKLNPKTGKPYSACEFHRAYHNNRIKLWKQN